MKPSEILDNSFIDIVKEVYDNPSNKNIVTTLREAGFEKNTLMDYVSRKLLSDEDIAYIRKFLQLCTLHLNKK